MWQGKSTWMPTPIDSCSINDLVNIALTVNQRFQLYSNYLSL